MTLLNFCVWKKGLINKCNVTITKRIGEGMLDVAAFFEDFCKFC